MLKSKRVYELIFHLAVDGGLAAAAALPIGENRAASIPMKDAKKPKVEQKIGKQEEKTHVKLIEKSNKENVKDIEPEEGQAGETSAALSAAPMTKPVGKRWFSDPYANIWF